MTMEKGARVKKITTRMAICGGHGAAQLDRRG